MNLSAVLVSVTIKFYLAHSINLWISYKQDVIKNYDDIFIYYGKETGTARSRLAEEVMRFGSGLYHAGRLSATLLAAILVLSNKLIDKERLKALWEEIKMLDILEIAEEKGMEKGKIMGIQEGKILGILEDRREMVTEALFERFSAVSARVPEQIRTMQNPDVLKMLHRLALKCRNLREFEDILQQVL